MAEKSLTMNEVQPLPPMSKWLWVLVIAWLIPGAGHFLLKKRIRGALLFVCVVTAFLVGLMLRGTFFEWQTGDLLTTIIYCGGFLADLASGGLYLLANALNYNQPDVAGFSHDYGTKFLVAAGLFNVLAIEDAFLIATGRKK